MSTGCAARTTPKDCEERVKRWSDLEKIVVVSAAESSLRFRPGCDFKNEKITLWSGLEVEA